MLTIVQSYRLKNTVESQGCGSKTVGVLAFLVFVARLLDFGHCGQYQVDAQQKRKM